MSDPKSILEDAKSASDKRGLDVHRDAIMVLREKGYTWREVAEFLGKRGINTDHTKLLRMFKNKTKKKKNMNANEITIPESTVYEKALKSLNINDNQRAMLLAHYNSLNRTVTYTELASAAGYDDYEVANSQYGKLGRALGEEVGFNFAESESRPGENFYSSSIGFPNSYAVGHFQLVMHHELSKAIENLGWVE